MSASGNGRIKTNGVTTRVTAAARNTGTAATAIEKPMRLSAE